MEPAEMDVTTLAADPPGAAAQPLSRYLDAGWKALNAGPFLHAIGPLLSKNAAGAWRYGVMTSDGHVNPAGFIHGGFLQAMMDHVLSLLAWEAVSRKTCVSLQTDIQFLSPVRVGEFVEAYGTETYRSGGMIFMRGVLEVDGKPVLNAQGIFRILHNK